MKNNVLYPFVALLKIILFFALSIILPRRGKRILFLTGVYARLVEHGLLHDETLEKLNRSLMLADSTAALNLPPSIYRRVIDDEELSKAIQGIEATNAGELCLTFSEARKVSQQIVKLAPAWARYGEEKEMERDVVSLFYCGRIVT